MIKLTMFIALLLNLSIFAQFNYLDWRAKSDFMTCGERNIAQIDKAILELSKVQVDSIAIGRLEYHYDFGMMYYNKALLENNFSYFEQAKIHFTSAISIDKKSWFTYNNLLIIALKTNNCEGAEQWLEAYKKCVPLRERDRHLIKRVQRFIT